MYQKCKDFAAEINDLMHNTLNCLRHALNAYFGLLLKNSWQMLGNIHVLSILKNARLKIDQILGSFQKRGRLLFG